MREKTLLSNLKVLDLTSIIMGPLTTQMLGDFGAEVIKIEDPKGDISREIGPSKNNKMSSMYLGVNRNKKSIVLNLKRKLDKIALWKLIERSDVFIHSIRPQKVEALGFSPNKVLKRNPKIIYVGLHGYGEEGPYAGQPAFDDVIQSEAGIADSFLKRGAVPELAPSLIADKSIGLLACSALLAAYIRRLNTNEGGFLEISMFEGMVSYTLLEHLYGETFIPIKDKIGYPRVLSSLRKPYKSKDGYISILPYTNKQWKNFFKIIKEKELINEKKFSTVQARTKNIKILYNIISRNVETKTNNEWKRLLKKYDIPFGLVNKLENLKNDTHLKAVNFFKTFEHPSEGKIIIPKTGIRFNKKDLSLKRHQPKLGENSEEILKDLGFKSAEMKKILD